MDYKNFLVRSLASIFNTGRLGGSGYVSILPVDQGIEHSAGASFAPNPIYFDPEKEKYESNHHVGLKITLALSTLFILVYFIYPSGITEIVSKINII